jgi:putative flippase GtrA
VGTRESREYAAPVISTRDVSMQFRPIPGKLLTSDHVAAQMLRYLVVGGVAFAVDFSVLVFCTSLLGVAYLISAAIAFCCGLAVNYVLSITWVFGSRSLADKKTEFTIFAIIGVAGLGWTELLMYLGTSIAGLDYRVSKIITVVIVLFWNFGMRKVILFRSPTK